MQHLPRGGGKDIALFMTSWKQQLERLFRMHGRHVEQIAFRHLRDRDAAADVVQDVFAKLLSAEARADEAENVRILFTAIRNETRNYISGSQRRAAILSGLTPEQMAAEQPSTHAGLEASQALATLEEALAALPERTRQIFIRRRLHDHTNAQIARDLGISVRAVEKHLVKAMEHCRSVLDDYFSS